MSNGIIFQLLTRDVSVSRANSGFTVVRLSGLKSRLRNGTIIENENNENTMAKMLNTTFIKTLK